MKEHEYKEHEDEEHENEEQEKDPLNNKSNEEKLKEHLSNEEIQVQYYTCTKCDKTYTSEDEAKKHVCSIKCDQCDYQADDVSSVVTHIRMIHGSSHQCNFCDYTSKDYGDLAKHSHETHEDNTILNTMFDQVRENSEQLEAMKIMLKEILQGQNEIKQEVFILRNNHVVDQRQENYEETSKERSYAEVAAPCPSSNKEPRVPQPHHEPPPYRAPQVHHEPHQESYQMSANYDAGSKILFVGDSISANINLRAIENATQRELICAKAYSAVHDTTENAAKKAARFPKSNFTDIVPAMLRKQKYHSLILQSGSADISNFNTKSNPEEFIEYFKQETVLSAKNIFAVGQNALHLQPSLEKVVIMKQIPRYDQAESDPMSLKPAL